MNKKFLYLFILFLFVFNVLLISKSIKEVRSSIVTSLLTPSNESILNKRPEKFLINEIYSQVYAGEKRFYVVTIIQELGCGSCIRKEIETINALPNDLLEQLIVVLIGNNKNALKDSGLRANYLFYSSVDKIFNDPVDFNTLNPISLLLDKNFIYDVRKVDLAKPKSDYLTQSYYYFAQDLFTH